MNKTEYIPINKKLSNIVFTLCCVLYCMSYRPMMSFFWLTGFYLLYIWGIDLYFEHDIRRLNQLIHLVKNDIHNIPTHPFR